MNLWNLLMNWWRPRPKPTPKPTPINVSLSEILHAEDNVGSGRLNAGSSVREQITTIDAYAPSSILVGVETWPTSSLPEGMHVLSYKGLSLPRLDALLFLIYEYHSDTPSRAQYQLSTTGDTLKAHLARGDFTDYLFLISTSNGKDTLVGGAGYKVNADNSVTVFQHFFLYTNTWTNLYTWMLLKRMLEEIPQSSKTPTTPYRFIFSASNARLLTWFQQKALNNVRIGRDFPDVLRVFLLRPYVGDQVETSITYPVLSAYAALTEVPKFLSF